MYRERLTITLDAALLQGIDSLVDGELLRNRSQTIEHLLKEGIGLHQLKQAFVFMGERHDPAQLVSLASLCASAEIRTVYLCAPLALKHLEAEAVAIITDTYAQAGTTCTIEPVPADFGNGGSLILKKTALTTPFLIAFTDRAPLPPALLPVYLFHRSHHGVLTEVGKKEPYGYHPSGLSIASPEITAAIPAGASSLEEDVFPVLLKAARVKGYFFSE